MKRATFVSIKTTYLKTQFYFTTYRIKRVYKDIVFKCGAKNILRVYTLFYWDKIALLVPILVFGLRMMCFICLPTSVKSLISMFFDFKFIKYLY